jgi:lipopolysaccharide export LptBFGC system permease protein LptF
VIALLASLLVTLAYHLGYAEFRNKRIGLVLLGNGVITLAYLISASSLAALIAHTAMHIAAVHQGPETTIQLPPHEAQPD